VLIGVVLSLGLVSAAPAAAYAPVDQPGPPLDVPAQQLDAALHCASPLRSVTRDVVLMIPGTIVDPDQAYGWNYEVAFRALGIPFCTVTVPNHTDGDIQVAAEYVVAAVRTIHAATGRQVELFGWSQGASGLPRWALRFWPDVRPLVASLVGLAPLNNIGTVVANAACAAGSCIPAAWQQAVGSHFMAALNSGQETFSGIAYTAIYTRIDDVVTPNVNGALSKLPPGPNVLNVAIQDVCPSDVSDHLAIVASPTAYAIAIDALQHPGQVANLARANVPRICLPGTMPYVSPLAFAAGEAGIAGPIPARLLEGEVSAEPPLRCYATASCS
jgi:triacylglycerol esterase/lipase EstA (alpha/beta hydrolase family)